jgi:hypothetical protein
MVIFLLTVMFGLVPIAQAKKSKAPDPNCQVFGFNDLGMHCYDKDFSVFSLLPPFNTIHAQVIKKDVLKPVILDSSAARVTYRGDYSKRYGVNKKGKLVLLGSKSITTTSGVTFKGVPKTNFWTYVGALFGAVGLQVDVGLTGTKMPDAEFGPQSMTMGANDVPYQWFTAEGIPLNETDDKGKTNNFPFMKLEAFSPSGESLGTSLDVVLPTSTEFRCAACHETDSFLPADMKAGITWAMSDASPPPRLITNTFDQNSFSTNPDFQIRFRENILILHDHMNAGNDLAHNTGFNSLFEQYQAGQPILCAQCHYSKALDLSGTGPDAQQQGHFYLSRAMHKHHGTSWPMGDGTYVIPIPQYPDVTQVQTCYYCHPGNETLCLRSVMGTYFGQLTPAGGCQNCHGNLLAVGGFIPDLGTDNYVTDENLADINNPGSTQYILPLATGSNAGRQRQPWTDLPKCQSCHTGTAVNQAVQPVNPLNQYVGTQAYTNANAASASPIISAASPFAENADTLYRFSQTHGGLACESCHGSTHAEWPARNPGNDNQTAQQIQGHPGEIAECGACHLSGLAANQQGPHGLHNVNDAGWLADHWYYWANNSQSCKGCHGPDLKGTVLSKAKADRKFPQSQNYCKKIKFAAGQIVGCTSCHSQPIFQP